MAMPLVNVPPLDPGLFTGPSRQMSGVGRTDDVVLDTRFAIDLGTPEYGRWLYVGVTGDVNYTKWDGTTQTLVGLAAGVWHPIQAIQVNTVGTTATNIVWGS